MKNSANTFLFNFIRQISPIEALAAMLIPPCPPFLNPVSASPSYVFYLQRLQIDEQKIGALTKI